MKAIVVTDRANGSFELAERPAPGPGPGELLVRVMAAGVNPVDWKVRSGLLGRALAGVMPEIPGLDVAGVVEAVGPEQGAGTVAVGSRVFGLTLRGGAFAELAALPQASTAAIPEGVGFPDAAALPVAGLTALQSLRDLGRLERGQRLLVNGASGGVGTFAVQLGRHLGAQVTAVTSTRNKEMVSALGADLVVDYHKQDFLQLPDEYQVIFDAVASRRFSECARRLARGGTYVTTLPGTSNVAWAVLTRLGLGGGRRVAFSKVRPVAADLAYLAKLVADGTLKVVIEQVYPLERAAVALDESRAGHVRGKLVLSVGTTV